MVRLEEILVPFGVLDVSQSRISRPYKSKSDESFKNDEGLAFRDPRSRKVMRVSRFATPHVQK